ncbi:GTA-gp10 family protein [Brevundimonas aveniformis]|uniref:GTA-gp10 family protein n=1 Tax=Brevundimonas aveniformis TaxID=370977 RepID=UPI00040D79D9|nr:GTA-gp10 family protein [Brevundimonas aveniformis]
MNAARGEAEVVIDGERVRLCLTLGALAEIEAALNVEGVSGLVERLRTLRSGDLAAVLSALISGGGREAEAARRLAGGCDPRTAAAAVARAFEAAA